MTQLTHRTKFRPGHKQSFSTREIREQHLQIQKKYRQKERKRHWSEPIDFEGELGRVSFHSDPTSRT